MVAASGDPPTIATAATGVAPVPATPDAVAPVPATPDAVTETAAVPGPVGTTTAPTGTTATTAPGPVTPAGDERRLPHLEVELRIGDDPAVLRLTGIRRPRAGTPYGWWPTGQNHAAPPAATAIPVGDGPDGQFWIDLRQAPDVLAVTGPTAARHRAARLLATRLLAAGAGVTVVGDGVTALPQGCRRYPADVTALVDDATASAAVTLVAEPAPDQLPAILALAHRTDAATVPVVVTAGPPARWTLQMVDG